MPEISFHQGFHPLTAHPFDRDDCREVPPCAALRPYVRCFWGPVAKRNPLVVPDACADIIIVTEGDIFRMFFCPVDNTPYSSHMDMDNMFGVRFYFWALAYFQFSGAFDEESFPDLQAYLLREGFLEAAFPRRQAIMEEYLLGRLSTVCVPAGLLNGVDILLARHGSITVREAAAHAALSPRTMERMFLRYVGLTPKEAAGVVRYQTLWQRCLFQPRFNLMDQVEALGFYDQAHLLNTFRRYHSMPMKDALALARSVAFLQDARAAR